MAVIQPYEQKVAPQGGLAVQSTAEQFGAGVGAAIQNVGAAGMRVAETMARNEIENDVTSVHVETAKVRDRLQQKVAEMANQTQPGDTTYVDRVRQTVQDDLDALGPQFKTKQGQDLFARMSANMVSMYSQQAVAVQSDLQGEFARNQFLETRNSLTNIAAQDDSQVKDLIAQGEALINDPNSRFARVPESKREAFRNELRNEIQYQAGLGYARRNPNAVLGQVPTELREVVQTVQANPPKPGEVPNFKAPDVKPYDPTRISGLANVISQPSKYDQFFADAAQLYNLDPRELKLRAVVESGLNPTAVSNKNALGIMQFFPATAKSLGVNPNDPKAAIFAAAKLISEYRTKAGGDMALVDKMYYGGESGKKWGPNTAQYAANLAALRQAAGLGSQVAPQDLAPPPAQQIAQTQDWKQPKTGIDFIDSLPADKFFAVLSQAEQYQRAYDAQSERGRAEAERLKREARDARRNDFLTRAMGGGANGIPAFSEIDVMNDRTLGPDEKMWLVNAARSITSERLSKQDMSNPAKVREFVAKIDSGEVVDTVPLIKALGDRELSIDNFNYLEGRIRSGNTPFAKKIQTIEGHVWRGIQGNMRIASKEMTNPGTMANIAYQFSFDLQTRVEDLRKQGKTNIQIQDTLLNPASSEYILKPGYLDPYIGAAGTSGARVAQSIDRKPDGDLVVGNKYVVNGQLKDYLGGPRNLSTSWK